MQYLPHSELTPEQQPAALGNAHQASGQTMLICPPTDLPPAFQDRKIESTPTGSHDETLVYLPAKTATLDFSVKSLNQALQGRYLVQSEIGLGGMGKVFKAFDPKLDRPVAIKSILTRFFSPEALQRFQFEAQATARLHHPNIVQIYEVLEVNEVPLLVMEFVEGINLAKAITERYLSRNELVSVITKVCAAIHFSHGMGIIHRDIKPANVMINAHGEPKVMDFGLAKKLEPPARAEGDAAATESLMGSPHYMSPEQAMGHDRKVGIASDIYSLGVTLFFGLTGSTPFHGKSVEDVVHHVIHTGTPSPRLLDTTIAPDLDAICLKAMQKQPEQRYERVSDMADDLHRWKEGLRISARRYGFWEQLARAIVRRKEVFAGSVFGVLVMLTGIGLSVQWLAQDARQAIVDEMRQGMQSIAVTTAMLTPASMFERLHQPGDERLPEAGKLIGILSEIMKSNSEIRYLSIFRRGKKPNELAYVVRTNTLEKPDPAAKDSLESVLPGDVYKYSARYPAMFEAFAIPTSDAVIELQEAKHSCVSGYAPIRNAQGEANAIVAVRMGCVKLAEELREINMRFRDTLGLAIGLALVLIGMVIVWILDAWDRDRPNG